MTDQEIDRQTDIDRQIEPDDKLIDRQTDRKIGRAMNH